MNKEKYYIVDQCSEDNWEQISQALESYEQAVKFKESDFIKSKFPKSFIVCSLPSELLKQNKELIEMLEAVKYQLDDDYQTLVEELIKSTNP